MTDALKKTQNPHKKSHKQKNPHLFYKTNQNPTPKKTNRKINTNETVEL